MVCELIWMNVDDAKAGEFNKKLGIGARLGIYNTASSDMGGYDSTFDTVPVVCGSIVYFLNKSYSVELSSQYLSTDVELKIDDNSGTLGEITQVPILLTARYQHPIQNTNTNLYLGLGAGYFINDIKQKNRDDVAEIPELNFQNVDVNAGFGWHGNVGVEMFFKEHYSVCLDLRVIFTEAEFDLTNLDGTKESRDMALNASVLAIGFNYYF